MARSDTPTPAALALRDQIIAKAEHLFRRFGASKTTIADIAGALGMSPSNMYNFFPNKNAIIEAVGERLYDRMRVSVMEIIESRLDPWTKFERTILTVHRRLREHLENEPAIMGLLITVENNGWNFVKNFEKFLLEVLTTALSVDSKHKLNLFQDPARTVQSLLDCVIFGTNIIFISGRDADEHEQRLHMQLFLLKKAMR
ncbi:MAG: TetR/AcrR family transcriptional regulator [Janthinobacterium lividum]